MPEPLVISIDAMGGDHGPEVIVSGVALAAPTGARFLLHGARDVLETALAAAPAAAAIAEIRHTEKVVPMDAKPAHAMRRGAGTSMWNAVESVRAGEAQAAVSAGNTGALMAIGRLLLRMSGELERPALVANWPTSRGVTAVLDVGANVVCDAERLAEFAILGAAYHRALRGDARPSVGLLNIGAETEKGHEEVRGADRILRAADLGFDYRGFVEGDDITAGVVDVIVTDGFTGNVALKTAEGLARFFRSRIREALTDGVMARFGAALAAGALRRFAARLDPAAVNGGPFLGLKGIVVKSHGGADAAGFAAAIRLAASLAASGFAEEIADNLARFPRARLRTLPATAQAQA